MAFTQVYVGMGSNLDTPVQQLKDALAHLEQIEKTQLVNCSSFYASKPMGPQDQPDYVNSVAELDTQLSPIELLHALQRIELEQGRQRKNERWGPRTLDLDILLFGDLVIHTKELTVPHYGMQEREFVLYPLFELNPDLMLPCGNSLETILNQVSKNGLEIISQAPILN